MDENAGIELDAELAQKLRARLSALEAKFDASPQAKRAAEVNAVADILVGFQSSNASAYERAAAVVDSDYIREVKRLAWQEGALRGRNAQGALADLNPYRDVE